MRLLYMGIKHFDVLVPNTMSYFIESMIIHLDGDKRNVGSECYAVNIILYGISWIFKYNATY